MHPAKSVIFFTTASGAGYGLMMWLGLAVLFQWIPQEAVFGFVAFGLAFSLIVGGLLSSTFHLGHPERAWRAMSQWRSSWLSREGLAAVLSFGPMGLLALGWCFGLAYPAWFSSLLALATIAMALITVYCTAMIYASLKSIPAWYNIWTKIAYLLFSLMTGALLLACLAAFWGYPIVGILVKLTIILLAVGGLVKFQYWNHIKKAAPVSTSGSATGLGKFGKVTLIDSPHSGENYLLEEMGFRVARKHSEKLRRVVFSIGFLLPLVLTIAAMISTSLLLTQLLLICAVLACALGIVVERWLFFAEAKHVVTLYYGEQQI